MPRIRELDLILPASPDEVEEALAAQTKRALWPSLATVWSGSGGVPFKGKVADRRFVLAPNERSFARRVHSTARGDLSQTSTGGTRLRAQVGLSPAMVWLYRLSVIWGAAVVAIVGGTGWVVNKAESEIDWLANSLESVAMGAAPALSSAVAQEEPQAEAGEPSKVRAARKRDLQ